MDHRRFDAMVQAFVRVRTALQFAIRGLTQRSLAGAIAARL